MCFFQVVPDLRRPCVYFTCKTSLDAYTWAQKCNKSGGKFNPQQQQKKAFQYVDSVFISLFADVPVPVYFKRLNMI